MNTRAVYPGSFDPFTFGHADILYRSAKIFDEVIVLVANNPAKKYLFTLPERITMIMQSVYPKNPITVMKLDEHLTTVDFCEQTDANFIVRGIRALTDYEYETGLAQMNKAIAKTSIETVCLFTSSEWAFVSSSFVKEAARYGKDISKWVPHPVVEKFKSKFGGQI